MNRLFQHYEGEISEIIGRNLEELKVLFDTEEGERSGNVILFWLKTSQNYLRIFVDGAYCGVDEYLSDESESDGDADDEVEFISYNELVKGFEILNAKVTSHDLPKITLQIELSNGTEIILDNDINEFCSLKIKLQNEV